MSDEHVFEVWNGDEYYAGASGSDRAKALREALHYVHIFGRPAKLYEVKRTEMNIKDAAEWLAETA